MARILKGGRGRRLTGRKRRERETEADGERRQRQRRQEEREDRGTVHILLDLWSFSS